MPGLLPIGTFAPARGLSGPHAQTVWGAIARPRPRVRPEPEAWETPDGDVLDLDLLPDRPGRPGIVVVHGLEGSSRAKYVRGILRGAFERAWNGAAMNFRSCGPTPHRLPRTYHSGETRDLDHVVRRLAGRWRGPLAVVGFSLGGNVVLKWLGEEGDAAPVHAGAAVSVPFDLARAAAAIDAPGFWSLVYRARFLRSLRRKALRMASSHPGVVDVARLRAARSFAAFDDVVTARIHGFRDAEHYWAESSSAGFVPRIRKPTLIVSAADDPMVPAATIPVRAAGENPAVRLVVTERGGHVGFVGGSLFSPRYAAEEWVLAFLDEQLGRPGSG